MHTCHTYIIWTSITCECLLLMLTMEKRKVTIHMKPKHLVLIWLAKYKCIPVSVWSRYYVLQSAWLFKYSMYIMHLHIRSYIRSALHHLYRCLHHVSLHTLCSIIHTVPIPIPHNVYLHVQTGTSTTWCNCTCAEECDICTSRQTQNRKEITSKNISK